MDFPEMILRRPSFYLGLLVAFGMGTIFKAGGYLGGYIGGALLGSSLVVYIVETILEEPDEVPLTKVRRIMRGIATPVAAGISTLIGYGIVFLVIGLVFGRPSDIEHYLWLWVPIFSASGAVIVYAMRQVP
jgi:hypothetical protein